MKNEKMCRRVSIICAIITIVLEALGYIKIYRPIADPYQVLANQFIDSRRNRS